MRNLTLLLSALLLILGYSGCDDAGIAICPLDSTVPPTWDLDTLAIAQEVAVNGIWGASQNEVYAVGMVDSGQGPIGVVWRYNGTDWSEFYTRPNADLRDIHGVSPHSVWVAGIHDPGQYPGEALVLHWNGSIWEESLLDPSIAGLLAIWAGDDDDVYGVGRDGIVLHFDGVSWTQEDISLDSIPHSAFGDIRDVWGMGHDSEQHVYIAAGTVRAVVLAKHGEGSWQIEFIMPFGGWEGTCVGVWARSAEDVYALEWTGAGAVSIGRAYHYEDTTLNLTDLRSVPGVFRAIRGDPEGDVFALGGYLYQFEGNSVEVYDSFPGHGTFALNDVWPDGHTVLIAGSYAALGVILRGDLAPCSGGGN